MKSYKLSVRLMTYNHGRYIEEALKGIDIQKTDFNFEVVVGDDFSTDETLSKIKNYNFCNPNLHLRVLEREIGDSYYKERIKKGRLYNFVDILNNCKGNYIALLDGDDYWTDPFKLQKQVVFLEERQDCSFCFHQAYKKIQGKEEQYKNMYFYPQNISKKILDVGEYLSLTTTATCSLVFRNTPIKSLNFLNHSQGDFLLYCELLENGKAGYINEIMSVYRKHPKGISYYNSSQNYLYNRVRELKIERNYFTNKAVKKEINRIYCLHVEKYLKLHKVNSSFSKILYLQIELFRNKYYLEKKLKRLSKRVKRKFS